MDNKTLTALCDSIDHWHRLATGQHTLLETCGADSCALCGLFFEGDGDYCVGCPVREKTGIAFCHNTPHAEAVRKSRRHGYGSDAFKAAAERELEFLKSLMPKSE